MTKFRFISNWDLDVLTLMIHIVWVIYDSYISHILRSFAKKRKYFLHGAGAPLDIRYNTTAIHSSALICPPFVHVHELFSKWNFVLTKKLESPCLESKWCSLFSSFRFFMDSLSAKLFSFINSISLLLGIIAFIDLHSLI